MTPLHERADARKAAMRANCTMDCEFPHCGCIIPSGTIRIIVALAPHVAAMIAAAQAHSVTDDLSPEQRDAEVAVLVKAAKDACSNINEYVWRRRIDGMASYYRNADEDADNLTAALAPFKEPSGD